MRDNYREQKRIFDEALKYGNDDTSEINPDEIDFLVDDLFKLEINGKTLKSIVDNIKSKTATPKPKSAAAKPKLAYSPKSYSGNFNKSKSSINNYSAPGKKLINERDSSDDFEEAE